MLNIAFIYEYSGEVWNTPLSLQREFSGRGWLTDHYQLSEIGISQFLSSEIIYDLLIIMDWKGLRFERLDKRYLPNGLYVISEAADCPQNFDKHIVLADRYHSILCPAYDSTEKFKEMGYDGHWLPHWTDTRIYQPIKNLPSIPVVCSRGPGGSQFLDTLSSIMGDKFVNKNGWVGREHSHFLSSGKIVLQNSRWQEFTRRIPEAMSTNTMVLTDKLPKSTNIDALYTEGVDYVTYTDLPDCISKINYYLRNDRERNKIASNGYIKTITNHTQVQRVDTIIKNWKEWKNTL